MDGEHQYTLAQCVQCMGTIDSGGLCGSCAADLTADWTLVSVELKKLRADLAAVTAAKERAERQRDRLLDALRDPFEPQNTTTYLRHMADGADAKGIPMTADFLCRIASALDAIAEADAP